MKLAAIAVLVHTCPTLATQYFQVSRFVTSGQPDQAYVLPLEDPSDIAHAKQLIAKGPSVGSPLVVAKIAEGSDDINRDTLAAGEPFWSWHVSQFEGFADFTIELCDGNPQFVENDVAGWIANTSGQICFWSYTVTGFLSDGVAGDYDGNGMVDAADYTVWRDTLGSQLDLRADGNGNGRVDPGDYRFWKVRFGNTVHQTLSVTVPEPIAVVILFSGLVGLGFYTKRSSKNDATFALNRSAASPARVATDDRQSDKPQR
jgi:hypothetical protein